MELRSEHASLSLQDTFICFSPRGKARTISLLLLLPVQNKHHKFDVHQAREAGGWTKTLLRSPQGVHRRGLRFVGDMELFYLDISELQDLTLMQWQDPSNTLLRSPN
jgi:hypothetical protein